MAVVSANRLELLQIADAVAREKVIDRSIVIDAMEDARGATYSVAWIDCLARGRALGRSLVMLGEHATLAELDATRARDPLGVPARRGPGVPFTLPVPAPGGAALRLFNGLYHRHGARRA